MYSAQVIDDVRHCSCCTKALAFNSLDNAEIGRQRLIDRYGEDEEQTFCYYCVFCNLFHIGRRPKATVLIILADIEALLNYDFTSECPVCGRKPNERSPQQNWKIRCGAPVPSESRRPANVSRSRFIVHDNVVLGKSM